MSNLLLTLGNLPRPKLSIGIPVGLPSAPTAWQILFATYLWELRQELFGPHPRDGGGNVEAFWEMAALLGAAVNSDAREVWLRGPKGERLLKGDYRKTSTKSLDKRLGLKPGKADHLIPFGPIPEGSPLWLSPEQARADSYGSWPIFKKFAGRKNELVGLSLHSSAEREISQVMSDWARTGLVNDGEQVVVRATRGKSGSWNIPAFSDPEKSKEVVNNTLARPAIHLERLDRSFLLQQRITMTHEYRIFIVNGTPVTGSARIEEFTPIYSSGLAFDTKAREHRSVRAYFENKNRIVKKPKLIERYKEAAEEIAANVNLNSFTVDLAYSPASDSVVMVKASGLRNSRLYASQPHLVAEAVLES